MERPRRPETELRHSLVPFGLNEAKPRHFSGMLRILWQNRDNLGHAWRVLTRGVCDGCALGTSGIHDWTIQGWHLCMVRLELLRLNTMPALDIRELADVRRLKTRTSKELRDLGRLGQPMRRRRGESGFSPVSFDELWADVGDRWRLMKPDRTGMFVTSRGITNEVYYTAQKVMRFLGTNNVDNSARLCHSPSTAGLKSTIGVAATTCSYTDWYKTDLIVFFGSNPANDQPVAMKYLVESKRLGARVITVNTYREPGMERYWVPSDVQSALFGTRITDQFYLVKVGGDLAFLCAVQKILVETGAVATDFIQQATTGFEELSQHLAQLSLPALCERAGTSEADVRGFAAELSRASRAVLVWSMGITQHAHGADTVRAVANLGLLREYVGREGCGLMPIRGHSGVQGGAEMGAYATALPGGVPINEETARRFSNLWGFEVPAQPGLATVALLEAARRGEVDGFYCIGGNFLETMPRPDEIAEGLRRISVRLHSDIVVTTQMLEDPADVVYLLPAKTRYEQEGGGTETSTERRVIFSPQIPGNEVGETRSECQMLQEFARAVRPKEISRLGLGDGRMIRAEIALANPAYRGIEKLEKQGDQFQWGGPHLCADRRFPTSHGKAQFVVVTPPGLGAGDVRPKFRIATRRGKQFNSMVQAEVDPITGAGRNAIFISPEDAEALAIQQNDPIRVRSECGSYDGRAFITHVRPGTLQGHWPEINHLIPSGIIDEDGGVPDYNADVAVERLDR